MSPKISEKELLERLAELPREKTPGRDPWPAISAAIERQPIGEGASKPSSQWWLKAIAASIVFAFAAGLFLNTWLGEQEQTSRKVVTSGPVADGVVQSGLAGARVPGLLRSVDAEYVAAFREFIGTGDSRDTLAQQTVEKIEMSWADLRMTEKALTAALDKNPGNLFLNERMLELRSRQLGFLKQLVSLERNNRRLTI